MNPTLDHSSNMIALRVKNGFRVVRCEDIVRCEAAGNYTRIFLADGQEITVCKRLKEVEAMLRGVGFCRVHQSHIVNVFFVEMWVREGGDVLQVKNGGEVPVGRGRKKLVKEMLNI